MKLIIDSYFDKVTFHLIMLKLDSDGIFIISNIELIIENLEISKEKMMIFIQKTKGQLIRRNMHNKEIDEIHFMNKDKAKEFIKLLDPYVIMQKLLGR